MEIKSARLAGAKYKIKYVDAPMLDDVAVDGLADPCTHTITLDTNLCDDHMTKILLHEILHVYDWSYGIDLKHRQVEALATCILDLIRNNPQLIDEIKG
jgi:hypothetical protein